MLREAATAAACRLYALGNRPGLVRAPGGAAIAGELCALPTTAVGALVAKVPWPFGFETVPLDDGPCLGFICGPAGVAGAANITPYGGWRAWLSAARS